MSRHARRTGMNGDIGLTRSHRPGEKRGMIFVATVIGFFFVISLALMEEVSGQTGLPLATATDRQFVVFDATLYKNKPDLSRYGIRPLNIIYAKEFWEKGESLTQLPLAAKVHRRAREALAISDLAVIDIEQWPVTGHSREIMDESVRKYVTVINWIKQAAPELRVGYFANLPVSDYRKSSALPGSFLYRMWQTENDRVRPIAEVVDGAFPAAYTYSADREAWRRSLVAQVAETRRVFSGPVYVFIWPQYFDHAPSPAEIQLHYLPADFWRFQLETARKHADGVVIWGGWNFELRKPADWDGQAPWWLQTQVFMRNLKKTPSGQQ